ncbi:MAG: hypothetical protein LBG72_04525 [Spirochaetaceae bacterium]|jgi:hypothetical protein|nr:hypothetical protein [Spirochaetaceae bacterium]
MKKQNEFKLCAVSSILALAAFSIAIFVTACGTDFSKQPGTGTETGTGTDTGTGADTEPETGTKEGFTGTWTPARTMPFDSDDTVYGIAYGASNGSGLFVAVGQNFVNYVKTGKIAWSANATDWTEANAGAFGGSVCRAVAYGTPSGSGLFVAVGDNGKIAWSADGKGWTAVSGSTFGGSKINAIAYGTPNGAGKFVAAGYEGKIAWSTDGKNWTAAAAVEGFNGVNDSINGIAFGGGRFVLAGSKNNNSMGKMAWSTDGVTWHPVQDNPCGQDPILAVAYGGSPGRFVITSESRKICYSPNGESWATVSKTPFGDGSQSCYIEAIAYGTAANGAGRFIAAGVYGKIGYSDDNAESWQALTGSSFSANLEKNIYGSDAVYAIAYAGTPQSAIKFVLGGYGKIECYR